MGRGGARAGAGNPAWKPKLAPNERTGLGRWCEDLFEKEQKDLVDRRLNDLPRRQRMAEPLADLKSRRARDRERLNRIPGKAQRNLEQRTSASVLERLSAKVDQIGRYRKPNSFARALSVRPRRPKGVRTKIIELVTRETNRALKEAGRAEISLETVRRCWIEFRNSERKRNAWIRAHQKTETQGGNHP